VHQRAGLLAPWWVVRWGCHWVARSAALMADQSAVSWGEQWAVLRADEKGARWADHSAVCSAERTAGVRADSTDLRWAGPWARQTVGQSGWTTAGRLVAYLVEHWAGDLVEQLVAQRADLSDDVLATRWAGP